MMMFEEALPSYLLSVDALAALVGKNIYGARRPQGLRPLPEILITRVQTQRQQKFCGQDLLVNADFQIDTYGMELTQVITCVKAISQVLRNFTGVMGDVPVDAIFLTNEYQVLDSDPGTVRIIQTFNCWYHEE